ALRVERTARGGGAPLRERTDDARVRSHRGVSRQSGAGRGHRRLPGSGAPRASRARVRGGEPRSRGRTRASRREAVARHKHPRASGSAAKADARVALETGARREGRRRVRVHGRRADSRPWVGRRRRRAPARRLPRVPASGAGIARRFCHPAFSGNRYSPRKTPLVITTTRSTCMVLRGEQARAPNERRAETEQQVNIMTLQDQSWVLVTGASSGFGEEFARQYAAQDRPLVLVARRIEKLQTLATELRERYRVDVIVEQVDLSNVAAVIQLHQRLRERGIAIDILINNAGHGLQGTFVDGTLNAALAMLQLDVVSLTAVTHLFAQDMRSRGR